MSNLSDYKLTISTNDDLSLTGNISANNITVSTDLLVQGDLNVTGTQTITNTTTLAVNDNKITLNSGASGTPSLNASVLIDRGSSSNVDLRWNESTDKWEQTRDGSTYVNIPISTTELSEGTNQYFTNARARTAISVTGSGSYDNTTGVITVTGGVTSVNTLTGAVTLSTTNISEGTNLYYTDTRANTAFDNRLAAKTTSNVAEGTNLYYTNARANSAMAAFTGNLTAGNASITGSLSATSIIVNGQPTTYGYVNGAYLLAQNNADQSAGQNVAVNFQTTSASNGSIITKTSNSQVTLTGGNTYKLEAIVRRLTSSSTWGAFRWYDVTNAAYVGIEGFSEVVTGTGAIGSTNVATAYVTPSVNTTYELRQTTVNTISVSANYATIEITQVNPTIAVQATATGTLNSTIGNVTLSNSYSQVVAASIPGTTIFTLPTLQPGTYLITARAKVNGSYSAMGIFTGGSQVANTSAFSWYQASGSVNNGLNGTWVLTVTTPTVYTINVWGGGTVSAGSDGSAVANYIQLNPTFALNALDTMTTTGNVSVGGNLNVTGTSTSLVTKASGLVNRGVDVTLGNLKARMAASGNASLQISTVSGTYSIIGSSITSQSNTVTGLTIQSGTPLSVTTTPAYLNASSNFGAAGATDTWNIMDASNSIAWRITLIVGASYSNNMISIERLL